jgi:cardiolipin synthase (CMP-forming)
VWLAHLLTLSRLLLAVLFWYSVGTPALAVATMATAALTDFVDGRVARFVRRRHAARGRPIPIGPGSWLDPLCDKTFVLSVIAATYVTLRPPLSLLVVISARELVLVPLAAAYRLVPYLRSRLRYDFTAGPLGKAATVAQFMALGAILLGHPARQVLAIVAGVVGVLAAVQYVARGIRLSRLSARGAAVREEARPLSQGTRADGPRANDPTNQETSETRSAAMTAVPNDATSNPGTSAAAIPNATPFTTR